MTPLPTRRQDRAWDARDEAAITVCEWILANGDDLMGDEVDAVIQAARAVRAPS